MIGDVTINGNQVYVEVNEKGTLRKLPKPNQWRLLRLLVLKAFGKYKHPQEVIEYLTTASTGQPDKPSAS